MTLRLYLAGPDVFRPESVAHDRAPRALCTEFGFIGLYPLDNAIVPQTDGPTTAERIYRQNIALIDLTDTVLANVAGFRGHEPDSGTCFEVGYTIAHNKDVWYYHVPAAPLLAQVSNTNSNDAGGWAVEDFGLPYSPMIACSCHLVMGDAHVCLEHMRMHYA